MNRRKTNNSGITLIALIITIVIIVILAGVSIAITLQNNGAINQGKKANKLYNYSAAVELLNLKITDVNLEKMEKEQRKATIQELAECFSDDKDFAIIVKEYNKIAKKMDNIDIPDEIHNIIVQLVKYPQYHFLIGESCSIEKVSIDDGQSYTDINKFNAGSPDKETINSFNDILVKNGIPVSTTKEEFLSNKDNSLETAIDNINTVNYIMDNIDEWGDLITSSQTAMSVLGSNAEVRKRAFDDTEWTKTIAESQYRNDFSEYITYDANTVIGTAGGRTYYKTNDGPALAAAFKYRGAIFIIVAKDLEASLGKCTYDLSYNQIAYNAVLPITHNGETWYVAPIPYGWNDGTGISTTPNCKNIGNRTVITSEDYENIAKEIINDYFGN